MNEITYTRQGDYLLPNLTMPEQPELSMGRYARMRKKFLKEHHKVRYYNLLTSCALNEHLNDTERRANEMEQMLTEQMAASEGVTENLKATDMMSWVRKIQPQGYGLLCCLRRLYALPQVRSGCEELRH